MAELLDDAFLRQLADDYLRERNRSARGIANRIAAERGAPVRTVHRWVSIARDRGHLPAGRQGSAWGPGECVDYRALYIELLDELIQREADETVRHDYLARRARAEICRSA